MGLDHDIMSSEIRRAEPPARTVVVGYDGSSLARTALELARRRAGDTGRVIAVYAAPLVGADAIAGAPVPVPPPVPPEELGQRVLADIERGPDDRPQVATEVRVGSAASALVEVANQHDAHEIVVGSHGAGRFRALLGSTSHALVHDADRPVVVVTERAVDHVAGAGEPARLLVVGYDGSDDARAAIDYARRHLAPGGEIVAVHAYHPPPEWKGNAPYNDEVQRRLADGRRLLDELSDIPEVSGELIADSPAAAIARVAAARGADEIVVGTRGVGTLRAALGSVAHAVLHEADRPVVIVPRPRER